MRCCFSIVVAGILLAAGCNSGSDPQAQRGASEGGTVGDGTNQKEESSPPGETTTVVIPPPSGSGNGGQAVDELGNEVALAAISLTAPEGWSRKAPSSSFVEAEFALPAAEGDETDGRLTVSIAGGSIEANIDRWKGQFGNAPEAESQKELEIDGITVTIVDFTGEFDDRRGPFAPGEKRAGYRMIAAIIPVGSELHFVKAVGPKNTMAAHAEEIDSFVKSLKKK